jgi:tetratricopeptide (TPR) repeat protein
MAAAYRQRGADYGQSDRVISFLKTMRQEHPENPSVAMELALAFVDKMPACGGLAAVVCQGTLARKGLEPLGEVIEAHPDSWLAHYNRGMNLLHWPTGLRKSDNAARDFERCLEIQSAGDPEPYHLKIHVGLGDAYAKGKNFEKARTAYRHGLTTFPGSEELAQRLALTNDDELWDLVKKLRSLEQDLDTDVSFFRGEY